MEKIRIKNYADIYVADYPFHKELKEEIVPLLEKYPDQPNINSNVKATHTEWDWGRDIASVKKFRKYILNEVPIPISRGGATYSLYCRDFWGNIYRKNDYTDDHNHSPYYMSFVYFLKATWYNSSLVFTHYGQKIRPREGKYVIFPSHLQHHVPKHRFRKSRITLSGNLNFKES